MDIAAAAARLRAAAEAKPLKLPVNRRVDETHHLVTEDGLGVWFTVQISPHARIQEALFERVDRMPEDDEIQAWLRALLPGLEPAEARERLLPLTMLGKALGDAADTKLLTAYGTLYRALGRLEKMGLLTSRWEDPQIPARENRPRRRMYALTAAGAAAAQDARKAAPDKTVKRAARRPVTT